MKNPLSSATSGISLSLTSIGTDITILIAVPGSITGTRGPQGLQGVQGIQGLTGPAGVSPTSVGKFSATIGDGAATSFVVTHNLGTQDVVMMVVQAMPPSAEVDCDMAPTSANTCTFAFGYPPDPGQYRVTIVG